MGDVKDETVKKIEDPPVKVDDKKVDLTPELKSAQETQAKVSGILEEHGYTNIDEMIEDIKTSKTLQKQVGTTDIKILMEGLEAKKELEKIHAYWAEQEYEKKLKARDDETAEERAERLEKELRSQLNSKKQEEQARKAADDTERAWSSYDKEVKTFLGATEVSPEKKSLLEALLLKDSFIYDIDIADKSAVKQMTTKINKLLDTYAQSTIEAYRKGKVETPKIPDAKEPVTINKEDRPKNIKDTKRFLTELLAKKMKQE